MHIEAAKELCRSLPGCAEDIKWENNLVFSVGGKMFAAFRTDAPTVSFKVDADRFLELTDRRGIDPAPYLARAKWVRVQPEAKLSDAEVAALLRRAWELVFARLTRKLQRAIDATQTDVAN